MMILSSSIMSRLDHQTSRIWIEFAGPLLETITKFDRLKNWVHTWLLNSVQEFDEKFLDSKHIFKVYFKPGWLKILHLSHVY